MEAEVKTGNRLDVAPFAQREKDREAGGLELRWEEPRDISEVVVSFQSPPEGAAAPAVRLEYWRSRWPESRREARGPGSGFSGWGALDDWFNGSWQEADAEVTAEARRIRFAMRPLAARERPDLAGYNVSFRRTLKLRLLLGEAMKWRPRVRAFTASALATAAFGVEWEEPAEGGGRVEVYNGRLLGCGPLGEGGGLRLRVRYVPTAGESDPDRTIVTVRTGPLSGGRTGERRDRGGFSFLAAPVVQGEPIWAPDLGIRVWAGERPPPGAWQKSGETIYERIKGEPEQTLRGAREAMPPKTLLHFALGCEGGRQKFLLTPEGDVICPPNFLTRVPARDTPRLKGNGQAAFRFGLGGYSRCARYPEEGYLPIVHTAWQQGGIWIEQVAFAAPATRSILGGEIEGDDPVALLARFRFQNRGDSARQVGLPLQVRRVAPGGEAAESVRLEGGLVWARDSDSGEQWLRLALSADGGEFAVEGGEVQFRRELGGREASELVVKIPFLALDRPEEIEALKAKEFDRELEEVRRYWRERSAAGCQIETPEQVLNDFWRGQFVHGLITDDREPGSERVMTRVGSFHYGNFANESCMVISNLDRRGYHREAERRLESFLYYQGTAWLRGNFSSKEGIFFGSGGYEQGESYCQHHGWVLWCLAEHYRLTRDEAWLKRAAPHLVAGCDWIVRERRATQGRGRRLERGFLPAGGLEDVKDYFYWLTTNVCSWWGLEKAARVLAESGHPEGRRLLAEAESYRQDLRVGFREASLRSPLVRLRDGSWVPHFPSRLYLRGRDFGWLRETLEGAIHLVTTELLAPGSREATWILKDYEDNRYLSRDFGYPPEERWWFERGGFSMQPNLLWSPLPYLLRDEVGHFLRAYFNAFASALREDTCSLTEHPLPTLADAAGDHFKTSDEANAATWLRMMLIQEREEELYLCRGLPRAWLAEGSRVSIAKAATHFGPMSMSLFSDAGRGRITCELDPPRRNPPGRILLRFRHPEKAGLQSVEVNGREHSRFDREREWVELTPAPRERVVVTAVY
jgi:hypothetical protein